MNAPRVYLPTIAELLDRMSIVLLKAIFITENRAAYLDELKLIEQDLTALLAYRKALTGKELRAILMLMLTNRTIWENESEARKGGDSQDHLLKFTHAINGCRTTAKNIIAKWTGERVDLKVDSWAASLPPELGQWDVWQ